MVDEIKRLIPLWTAEVSGMSEHFLTYIAALEGIENKFEEQ